MVARGIYPNKVPSLGFTVSAKKVWIFHFWTLCRSKQIHFLAFHFLKRRIHQSLYHERKQGDQPAAIYCVCLYTRTLRANIRLDWLSLLCRLQPPLLCLNHPCLPPEPPPWWRFLSLLIMNHYDLLLHGLNWAHKAGLLSFNRKTEAKLHYGIEQWKEEEKSCKHVSCTEKGQKLISSRFSAVRFCRNDCLSLHCNDWPLLRRR